jgi:hypothetical protein
MNRRILPRILATDVLKRYLSSSRPIVKGLENEYVSCKESLAYAKGLNSTTESIIQDVW